MPDSLIRRSLQEFVDRREELSVFLSMLAEHEPNKPILSIRGMAGMGKTSLLARLIHECSQRRIAHAHVDLVSTRYNSYLAVLRKARDDIGAPGFARFTDLVNFYTVPNYQPQLSHASLANEIEVRINVQQADSGSRIAGVNYEIRDSMLVFPRVDQSIPEAERMEKLTETFLRDLENLSAERPVVLFFDHIDRAVDDVRSWIWQDLLRPLSEGALAGVRFVLCGRHDQQDSNEPGLLWRLVQRRDLEPLRTSDIEEYLKRRPELGLEEPFRQLIAAGLFSSTSGVPLKVGMAVEAMVQARSRQERGQ